MVLSEFKFKNTFLICEQVSTGIRPQMFKTLIGRGHPEFSTKRQQDAQEFFLHLLTELEVCIIKLVFRAQCPVVESIVSLTSLLVVKMLTLCVLVSTISNSQVFLLKKMWVAFANAKATHIFFSSKNISIYAIFNDQSFNDTFTNDIISFEQLGPIVDRTRSPRIFWSGPFYLWIWLSVRDVT